MREFFHLYFTNLRWFVWVTSLFGLIYLFLWRLIDPTGFAISMNGFMHDVWEMVKFVLVIVLMLAGILKMFNMGPFKRQKSGHH